MEVRVLGAVTKDYDQLDQISKEGRGPTDRKSTQAKDGESGERGSGVPWELRFEDLRLPEFEAR